jgi:ABC-type sugar transport system ATPase subunit
MIDPMWHAEKGGTLVSPFSLELVGIRKAYGSIPVLHGIDFRVRAGTIHALLGANGAGKSTLLKIAVGATAPSSGKILVNGRERVFASPMDARRDGIGMVFQERSLIPDLSILDNIFLNGEPTRAGLINARRERREAHRIFERLGVRLSPAAIVSELGIADQQMVEIAKALRLASTTLILDEPTAALTEREVMRLFTVVRQIARSGVAIVYVSHRLAEIFDLCDQVTVIRDGRVVLSSAVVDTTMHDVVDAIAGGAVTGDSARASDERLATASGAPDQAPVLAVRGLTVGHKLQNVSFDVRAGEILGVAGLAGSGRSTMLKAMFGAIRRGAGEIRIAGRPASPGSPRGAIAQGLYLIPENRKTHGLVLSHSIEANVVLSILKRLCVGPFISARRSLRVSAQSIAQLFIRPADPDRPVEWLSGGNQQKVVLGKAFNARGRVLLLDEPTLGVDVRSRAEIRARVRDFAQSGNGVVWVTSDLTELADVSDRILVLSDGRVRGIVSNRPRPLAESEITHLIQRSADIP